MTYATDHGAGTLSELVDRRLVVFGLAAALAVGLALGRVSARQQARDDAQQHRLEAAARAIVADAERAEAQAALVRYKIPVTVSQPIDGAENALVTVVEWCDVRATECTALASVLDRLHARYGSQLRVVYRHFLDVTRRDALTVAEFSMIAHAQANRFWQVRKVLAEQPGLLSDDDLVRMGERVGLNAASVRTALNQHSYQGHVLADGVFAKRFGVTEMASVFVNGRPLSEPATESNITRLIDDELPRAKALTAQGVPLAGVYEELTKHARFVVPGLAPSP